MRVDKNIHFTASSLITTVDLGKKYNYGFIRTLGSEREEPFKFTNDAQGFALYWNKILIFKSSHKLDKIYFGFEPTGSYGHPLVYYMRNKGCTLLQVNPKHTKRVKEVIDNSPNKTDKKDPVVIANILLLGRSMSTFIPQGLEADLRYLVHSREVLMSERNRIINQLEGVLAAYFPEFLHIMPSLSTKSTQYVLKKYTLPQQIAAVDPKVFIEELRKVSRYQLKEERIRKLWQQAANTIGVLEGGAAIVTIVRMDIDRLTRLKKDMLCIEQQIKQKVECVEEGKTLLSIKGIQHLTAGAILGELGRLDQYANKEAILKMAGLNLFEISSGRHKGKRSITKRGRALVRKTLYLAVLNMVKKQGIYHHYYKNKTELGNVKMKVIVALMKKLLVTMYAMSKNKQSFIENYSAETKRAA